MIEVELKAVVDDLDVRRHRVESAAGRLVFMGRLEDRRYDRADRSLSASDCVLRVRVYRPPSGSVTASLDWKGPTSYDGGYKRREERSTRVADAESLAGILEELGYVVTMAIDRDIWQYELFDAVVRFERYPCMDDLVEVEGSPEAIERAIQALGLERSAFSAERLGRFVQRFEARTGRRSALSVAALEGSVRYDADDA